jgi:hypothetical protein
MKLPDKAELRRALIPAIILFTLIGISIYVGVFTSDELDEYGVNTVGYTTGTYTVYKNSSTRYFFKTPSGIYTGMTTAGNLKDFKYYRVRYSKRDPTISEIFADSLVPDSIGVRHIYRGEIYPENVINGEDVPDWQW